MELREKRNRPKWLAPRGGISSVEELETLPAGKKPRIPHHRSPGGERHKKRNHSMMFLERAIKGRRQTNTGTVSKTTPGKLLRDWNELTRSFPSA